MCGKLRPTLQIGWAGSSLWMQSGPGVLAGAAAVPHRANVTWLAARPSLTRVRQRCSWPPTGGFRLLLTKSVS
jgi:hypothetical protein